METIGETLKKARLAKGYTIDELQRVTKIQKRYLEAMEENRFSLLPGTYYARNFIRQYSSAVDLDAEYMVEMFDGIAPIRRSYADPIEGSRSKQHSGRRGAANEVTKSKVPTIILTIVSLLIVSVVVYLTLRENTDKQLIDQQNNVVVEESSTKSTSISTTASSVSDSSSTEKSTSTTESVEKVEQKIEIVSEIGSDSQVKITNATSPLKLSFKGLSAACWVGIMIDGQYVYDQTIQASEVAETVLPEGATTATLILGASGNIEVTVDGKAFDFNPNQTNIVQRNLLLEMTYADEAE